MAVPFAKEVVVMDKAGGGGELEPPQPSVTSNAERRRATARQQDLIGHPHTQWSPDSASGQNGTYCTTITPN